MRRQQTMATLFSLLILLCCLAGLAAGQTPPAPDTQSDQTSSSANDDDGVIPKGEAQSSRQIDNPYYRDNGNGTVTLMCGNIYAWNPDYYCHLTWTKNAHCFGPMDLNQAIAAANGLASGNCGLTDGSVAGDWRLPTRDEFHEIIDKSNKFPSLVSGYPFTGVMLGGYWTSTPYSYLNYSFDFNWYVDLNMGGEGGSDNKPYNFVWAVRDGNGVHFADHVVRWPMVISFAPDTGGYGTLVTINGHNFTGVTAVLFGGTPAKSFTVRGDTQITAEAGNGATGAIRVINPNGNSLSGGNFTFVSPIITSFTPHLGVSGTIVTITGSNFTGATAVIFGGPNAKSFTVNSDTQITAVVGIGATGTVAVVGPNGQAISNETFVFFGVPTVSSFTPTSGVSGTDVTITGTNFTGTTAVTFGGVAAQYFEVDSATQITAGVGTGATGTIKVTNPGATATSSGTFTFIFTPAPTISDINPNRGYRGTRVVITGTNLSLVTDVFFGSTEAYGWRVSKADGTEIWADLDTGTTGPVSVITPGGTAFSSRIFVFLGKAACDFDGDLKADILWRHAITGEVRLWQMNGAAIASQSSVATVSDLNWKIQGISDFSGDGNADLLWQNAITGEVDLCRMNGPVISSVVSLATVNDPNWKIQGIGDFNGDGQVDIIGRHAVTGEVYLLQMNGTTIASQASVATISDLNWKIQGIGDFDGNGQADILWRHAVTGEVYLLQMNGPTITSHASVAVVGDLNRQIQWVGDLSGVGTVDILWRNMTTGEVYVWQMNGPTISSVVSVATEKDLNWKIQGVDDFDGDGHPDIIWQNATTGEVRLWQMNGPNLVAQSSVATVTDLNWKIQMLFGR
ncbi:MAG: IPT/TIG domain-containing protein [Deltaproteobacteria bacterium]|nr:IPT/TIG domain-containing protein [Deltaproteobacteria bacterium]